MISFSKSHLGNFLVLIILISTASCASIGSRDSREVQVESTFHDEDAKQNLSSVPSSTVPTTLSESTEPVEIGNGTTVSLESVVQSESDNSTEADDNDVIYLTYPGSLFPYGTPVEDDDPGRWIWALDEALQKRREKEELDEFAGELEDLYTLEQEEYDEEEYDEEDEGNASDDGESKEGDSSKDDQPEKKVETAESQNESQPSS